jgi:hypothetical protein
MGTASKIPFCCTLMSPNMREKSREYDPTLLPAHFAMAASFFVFNLRKIVHWSLPFFVLHLRIGQPHGNVARDV